MSKAKVNKLIKDYAEIIFLEARKTIMKHEAKKILTSFLNDYNYLKLLKDSKSSKRSKRSKLLKVINKEIKKAKRNKRVKKES